MKNFKLRVNQSNELMFYFDEFLKTHKIPFYNSGYEYNESFFNAINLIKMKNDVTSKFIRYYPDKTLSGKNKSILIEIKNSSGIEQECYLNYMNLIKENVLVLLFLKNKKLCKVQDLIFTQVKEFDNKAKMIVPVIDNVWKTPRNLNEDEYKKYLQAYQYKTSGCAFAFIDFTKTKFYELDVLLKL